jgi:pSer/pThr/pTyr-binding forkhead associated (FHA) protein
MAARYQFVVRAGPNVGKVFQLEVGEITIGREVGNTIVISDAEISRRHAKLTWQGAGYFIDDAGSTNGTFVNGQRISAPHILKPGDLVSLSENITLVFEAAGDVNATVIESSPRAAPATVVPQATPPSPRPVVAPPPQPVYSAPVPVPAPPPNVYPDVPPPPEKKGSKIWLVLVILLVLAVCAGVGVVVAIDYFQLWCDPYLSWLTNIIAPIIGFGVCP